MTIDATMPVTQPQPRYIPFTGSLVEDAPPEPPHTHHLKTYSDGDSLSFKDALDIINPLQHLPVVSTIYRNITGDEPGGVARVAGGALYGGVIGLAYEFFNSIVYDETGKDVGEHAMAMITGDDDDDVKTADSEGEDKTETAKAEDPASVEDATEDSVIPPTAPAPAAAAPAAAAPAAAVPVAAAPAAITPVSTLAAGAPKTAAAQPQTLITPAKQNSTDPSTTAPASVKPLGARLASAAPTVNAPQGMPVPPRRSIQQVQPPPPGTVVTTSTERSNVLPAGRARPNNGLTDPRGQVLGGPSTPLTVPKSQTSETATPVTPVALSTPSPSASPAVTPTNAWLPDAMTKALEKYERMNKLGQTSQAPLN